MAGLADGRKGLLANGLAFSLRHDFSRGTWLALSRLTRCSRLQPTRHPRLLHSIPSVPVQYSLIVCFLGLVFVLPQAAQGAKRQSAWALTESANFRLFSRAAAPRGSTLTADFELLRQRLFSYWTENEKPASWSPKCDIVLHETDASYLAEVGSQAGSTVASSLLDDRGGKIVTRRIDVRGSCADWRRSAFPHELTHIVLADRFVGKTLPRWADEGMAILADPVDKQTLHWRDLQTAMVRRQAFRTVELMELRDYPAANRWGPFYGQSASLVRFLLERESPKKFLDFVDICGKQGSAAALKSVYRIDSTAACEQAWRQSLKVEPKLFANCSGDIESNPKQRTQSDQRPASKTQSASLMLVSE